LLYPAVVTVMYNPKYNGIDWDELTEENTVKAKRLKDSEQQLEYR